MAKKSRYAEEIAARCVMWVCVILVLAFVISIIWSVFSRGLSAISWDMLSRVPGKDWNVTDDGGFLNAIAGSLLVVVPATCIALFISVPIVFYMNLYLRRPHRLSYIIRIVFDVLYGIPSIVYGAFAFTIMVYVGMRASLLGGILVTTCLIIPMFIRSGDEISRSVPDEMIDAAYSLGATKYETIKVVLRQVLPGMATATLLAVGKAIGDAAAVMFTAGFSDAIPTSLSSPTATLPLAVFNWISMPEPFPDRAYSAALVLTVVVLILSLTGRWLTRHFTKHNM